MYRKPPKNDQTQTLRQAADQGLVLQSFCCNPACLNRTKEVVKDKISAFPAIENLTLNELKQKAICTKCLMKKTLDLVYVLGDRNRVSLHKGLSLEKPKAKVVKKVKIVKYEASTSQNVFHKSSCGFLDNTSLKDTIRFIDRADAIQQGFSPCKYCRP